MGGTKLMLTGVVAVIIGMYGLGIKRADQRVTSVAEVQAYQSQADQIAKSGINLAISEFRSGADNPNANRLKIAIKQLPTNLLGGALSYAVRENKAIGKAEVTVTVNYMDQTITRIAILKKKDLQQGGTTKPVWKIVKVYRST